MPLKQCALLQSRLQAIQILYVLCVKCQAILVQLYTTYNVFFMLQINVYYFLYYKSIHSYRFQMAVKSLSNLLTRGISIITFLISHNIPCSLIWPVAQRKCAQLLCSGLVFWNWFCHCKMEATSCVTSVPQLLGVTLVCLIGHIQYKSCYFLLFIQNSL